MTFHRFLEGEDSMYSYDKRVYGIKVLHEKYKECTKVDESEMGIILVPLTAFDPKSLNRIGYGGGYYDNFIKECRKYGRRNNPLFVGIGLECLKITESKDEIFNEYDQPLDYIITEKKIY